MSAADDFETADAPLCPNKADIAAHLYALFPSAFVHPHHDAPQGEGHVSLRLPRRATTGRDRYDDTALPQAIDDYDHRRDARHAIPKEQHRSNAEFGEAAFYGWSEDKARQAAKAEGAAFPPYLRAHGFTFD